MSDQPSAAHIAAASMRWFQIDIAVTDLIRFSDLRVKALIVILSTHKTVSWFAEHDPQVLKQAQESINQRSYENYL